MALGNCLQVSTTVGRATASVAKCYNQQPPVYFREKLINMQTSRSFNDKSLAMVSFTRSRSQKLRIVCKAKEAVDAVQVVTDGSWESQVIANENPVLVEFWAPWCGPCRMIAPVIDELAKEYAGKLSCFKVNTDDCPNIATQYGIRSIPTVLFFKNGEKKESVIGAVPKTTLSATIDKYLD